MRWLDLSFNLIEKIEGLDKNKQLEDLSLYSNQIKELSGLEELNKLNVLSVGRNKIDKLDNMLQYLKKLRNNLQVLKIEENDFKNQDKTNKDSSYRNKTIATLINLKYLDYKIITDKEREIAKDDQKEMTLGDTGETEGDKNNDEEEETINRLREAFIEDTYNLTKEIFKRCAEYDRLKIFKKLEESRAQSEGSLDT